MTTTEADAQDQMAGIGPSNDPFHRAGRHPQDEAQAAQEDVLLGARR